MVVEHGLHIAAVLGCHLGMEAGGLVFGVIELAESVTEFAPGDVELKTLGNVRMRITGARQR